MMTTSKYIQLLAATVLMMLWHSTSLQAQWTNDENGQIRSAQLISIVPAASTTGTWHPNNDYKLSIEGNFVAEEVLVEVDGAWPDYVFTSSYELLPLPQVAAFIDKHQHLPGLPSTLEVADTALGLGEAHRLLLEKLEELALYLIQGQERKLALEAEIQRLEQLLK